MKFSTYFKGNRTLIIARTIMLLGLLQQYGPNMFPTEYLGLIMFSIALLMELMRWITTTPVRKNV